jgi:hypothetical protein
LHKISLLFLFTVVVLAVVVQAELGDRALLAQISSSCDKTVVPPADCSEDSITTSADDDGDGSDDDDNNEENSKGGANIESRIPSVAGSGVPFP